jgi:uncharacterized protein (TIGR03437 family)
MMASFRFELLVLLVAGFATPVFAAPPPSCGTLNAGFQIVSNVQTSGSSYTGALKVAIWYPTATAAATYAYSGPGAGFSGQVALNAPPASCAQFPLVVFSHGWSGCGTQTVYLTEELARRGYIVAAPDHDDHGCSIDGVSTSLLQVFFDFPYTKFGQASSWTDQTAAYRNADIEAVLNYMLNTWTGKSVVNPSQIAAAGHSFGGYTAFGKVGGWSSWLDTRFKAAVLYSPYIQAFQAQNPETVSASTVPQLFMTGASQDTGIVPWVKGPQPCSGINSQNCGQPGAFEQSSGVKYYGQLSGAGTLASHLAFTNILCTNAGQTTVQSCLANIPNAQTVVNYTQDFLEHFLAGQAPQKLWSAGSEWGTYWKTAGVPAGSFKLGMGAAQNQIVSLFGEQLTTDTPTAADGALTMPPSIGRTTVNVVDSQGVSRQSNLYYISPSQVNLVVPDGTSTGEATVTVNVSGNQFASGPVTIRPVAPALFVLSGNVLAGWAQDSGNYLPIWFLSRPVPVPIREGSTYLIALGTGLRGAGQSGVTATIGSVQFDGVSAPLPLMVPSPSYQGLDQVNIGPLPASLRGAGIVNVYLTAGGQQTNIVQVALQ